MKDTSVLTGEKGLLIFLEKREKPVPFAARLDVTIKKLKVFDVRAGDVFESVAELRVDCGLFALPNTTTCRIC